MGEHIGVLRVLLEVFVDILDGDDGMDIDAELLFNLHDGGLFAVGTNLTAVDRDEHIGDLGIGTGLDLGDDLPDSGTGGDDIFHQDDAVAVHRLIADHIAAFPVVLDLLAVEEVRLVQAILSGQGGGSSADQRNPLVGGAEHGVKILAKGIVDQLGVELAEGGKLFTGTVVAGVDKIGGVAAAFGDKAAEAQNIRAHHEFDKQLNHSL